MSQINLHAKKKYPQLKFIYKYNTVRIRIVAVQTHLTMSISAM